jgi:hypothetical protein
MEGAERAKKTSDMCYKKWKNDEQPPYCDCNPHDYYSHGCRGCYEPSVKELGIEIPSFIGESNKDIADWFDSLREFKHPYLNDSPLPLVLEEIMKTKPIEEIEKVLEAAQIAEDAAKSRACEAEEKAKPFVEEADTARQEAAAFKRVRKAAQEKLS